MCLPSSSQWLSFHADLYRISPSSCLSSIERIKNLTLDVVIAETAPLQSTHPHLDHLKGIVSRDFRSLVFSWISFPQALEYTNKAVSNLSSLTLFPLFAIGINTSETGDKI
jgi:hypothetical protein